MPKMGWHAPTALVSSPTAQELETMASDMQGQKGGASSLDPTAYEFKGGMLEQGALPYLSPTP